MKAVSSLLRAVVKTAGKTARGARTVEPPLPAEFDYIPQPRAKAFTAGFGKREILPEGRLGKYYIAGYNSNNPAIGMLDAQAAHAFYLDDNSSRGGVLFVSVDCVGLMNADVVHIRSLLKPFCKKTGCRAINICATHDHAGIDTMGIWGPLPYTGKNRQFMDALFSATVAACEDAYASRRQGKLFYGTAEVEDMQEDIRLPIVYSKTLTRLRFVPADGTREIYFLNFASHSESLSGSNSLISADFPAYLRKEIEEKTGADTIYFVGAIGGMISMEVHGKSMGEKIRDTKALGVKLAGYAMGIDNEKELRPMVNILRQKFYFDCRNTVLLFAGLLDILNVKRIPAKNSSLGYLLASEMNYCEIDGLKMLFLPCELFPELAYGGYLSAEESAEGLSPAMNPVPLCVTAQDDKLLLFGLANDEVGYVLPPNDFMLSDTQPYLERATDRLGRRHYEECNSLGPATAVAIAETFETIMDTVKWTKKRAEKK